MYSRLITADNSELTIFIIPRFLFLTEVLVIFFQRMYNRPYSRT